MALLTEPIRISDVLLFEEGEEMNYVRDTITVVSGTANCVTGQVMGQITLGGASETHAGNTGNGAMTLDAAPVLANASAGVYKVVCTTAATNGGTFTVFDPKGRVIGTYVVGAAAFADQIKFTIADGATDFIAGDTFSVTVAAGSGKWAQVNPSAVDGSAVAAAVLLAPATSASADATAIAVVRGPAILKTNGLTWTSGMTSGQKTAALAQLAALGITARTDYGA